MDAQQSKLKDKYYDFNSELLALFKKELDGSSKDLLEDLRLFHLRFKRLKEMGTKLSAYIERDGTGKWCGEIADAIKELIYKVPGPHQDK